MEPRGDYDGEARMLGLDVVLGVDSVIAPAYANVNGGYTQVYKMGPRRGDGAETAIVRLTPVATESTQTK